MKLVEHPYEKGDLVYFLQSATLKGESKKLKPVYHGPVVISEVLSPVLYRVELRKRSTVMHHDRLKKCVDREVPLWVRRKRHQILEEDLPLPNSQYFNVDIDANVDDEHDVTILDTDDDIQVSGIQQADEMEVLTDDEGKTDGMEDRHDEVAPTLRVGRHRRRPKHFDDFEVSYDG